MPFKSQSQQKFLFANSPSTAREFAKDMTAEDFSKLPFKAKKAEKGSVAEAAGRRRKKKK